MLATRASVICKVVNLLLEYMRGYHMEMSWVYKVTIVFVAGPNKHEYLRRFIRGRGILTPGTASMLFDAGED